jgi:hypothetical protein
MFTSLTRTQFFSMDEYFEEGHKDGGAKNWCIILQDFQDNIKGVWWIHRRFEVFLSRKI